MQRLLSGMSPPTQLLCAAAPPPPPTTAPTTGWGGEVGGHHFFDKNLGSRLGATKEARCSSLSLVPLGGPEPPGDLIWSKLRAGERERKP